MCFAKGLIWRVWHVCARIEGVREGVLVGESFGFAVRLKWCSVKTAEVVLLQQDRCTSWGIIWFLKNIKNLILKCRSLPECKSRLITSLHLLFYLPITELSLCVSQVSMD